MIDQSTTDTAYRLCLEHAERLLNAATTLHRKRHYNLAYHLSCLSLEEIGASIMTRRPSSEGISNKHRNEAESHEKRLLWALVTPVLFRSGLDPKVINEFDSLAKSIHILRKKGLYVDIVSEHPVAPSSYVSQTISQNLLRIVRSRIAEAGLYDPTKVTDEAKKDTSWFQDYFFEDSSRRWVEWPEAINKLKELQHFPQWIAWLKELTDLRKNQSEELFNKEMHRVPAPDDEQIPKWKSTIRVYSLTHSAKGNSFNWWNNLGNPNIWFTSEGKITSDFLVHAKINRNVTIANIHTTTLRTFQIILTALKIGCQGFFWWRKAHSSSNVLIKCEDLEHKSVLRNLRSTELSIECPLDIIGEQDLRDTALTFGYLGHIISTPEWVPYSIYFRALEEISYDSLELRKSRESCELLLRALLVAMQYYEEIRDEEKLWNCFYKFIQDTPLDSDDLRVIYEFEGLIRKGKITERIPTLEDSLKFKILFDFYVLPRIRKRASQMLNEFATQDSKL